jgi:transposase
MDVIVERCCGLDVHQAQVTACLLIGEASERPRKQVQVFRALTEGLERLRQWLVQEGCTHVAMESTGVYWIPVYRVLEGHVEIVVGNATHMKNVPGRKTDVKDSEWIARLLRHGLIRKSYIPSEPFRELRELTRSRRQLVESRSAVRNRLLKALETANIKLMAVASDVFGASGRQMVRALVEGTLTPAAMANLAKGTLRRKRADLALALDGKLTDCHRFLIGERLSALDEIEARVARFDAQIDQALAPYEAQRALLIEIPGVDRVLAASIIAELGVDMSVFPTVHHAAAWAGVCPSNNESAGRTGNQPIRKGNVHLTTTLMQAAVCAANRKGSYLRAKYRSLRVRRGPKRAALAIAHKILRASYFVLMRSEHYRDLGETYLDQLDPARVRRSAVKRLESLGYDVILTPKEKVIPVT